MEFCLSQGSSGPEIGLLVDKLRRLGFDLAMGSEFTRQVSGALRVFQQSNLDLLGAPLRIDGRLGTATALAIDFATGRSGKSHHFEDRDLAPMPDGGSPIARRAASIAFDEYMRASGEQSGDNSGPDVTRYRSGAAYDGTSWSVDFGSYCYREGFGPEWSPLGRAHSVQTLLDAAWTNGFILETLENGFLPGDLIVWHFEEPSIAEHPLWCGQVGVVWSCDGMNVTTLEGDRGPFPSLVRPYRHKMNRLLRAASNGQLRDGISVIRIA